MQAIKDTELSKLAYTLTEKGIIASPEVLLDTLRKAPVTELLAINNVAAAYGLYLETKYAKELAEDEKCNPLTHEENSRADAMILANVIMGGAPACSLTELIPAN
jgi:hypothetical protein